MYLLILNFAHHRFLFYSLKWYLVLPDVEGLNVLLKQQLSEKECEVDYSFVCGILTFFSLAQKTTLLN